MAMWLILKQKKPNDFVVGSGVSKSLKEICNIAFSLKGLNWKKHIISSPGFYRKYEIAKNRADIRKIKKINWFPKITVSNILLSMIDRHIKLLKKKNN